VQSTKTRSSADKFQCGLLVRETGIVNIGWIWTDNLRPLLVELCRLVGYRFDDFGLDRS